jgi:hypothetical protein
MGADHDGGLAGGDGLQLGAAGDALVAAGEEDGADALASSSGVMVSACWRARISVGRHQRGLTAGGDGVGHGEEGDDGLAGADVALEEAAHALAGREVGADVGERPGLGAGEGEGEGGGELVGERAGRDGGGGLAAAGGFAEGQVQLVGEELVVGEAAAMGSFWG